MKSLAVKIACFIHNYFKWIFTVMSLCGIYLAWHDRYKLFNSLPFNDTLPFYEIIILVYDVIFALLLIIFFVAVIRTMFRPNILCRLVNKRLKRAGLRNCSDEPVTLVSRHMDKNRKGGWIYTIEGKGLTASDFTEKIDRLRTALRSEIIYKIERGRDSRIRVYALRRQRGKFNVTIQHYDDDAAAE